MNARNKKLAKILLFVGLPTAVAIFGFLTFNNIAVLISILLLIASATYGFAQQKKSSPDASIHLQQKVSRLESKAWYFESIVTNSKDILFTTDLEHRIIKFNKEAEETFGGTALERLGHHVRTLFEEPEQIDQMLSKIKSGGKANLQELRVKNQETGETFWVSVQISKLAETDNSKPKILDRNKEFLGEIFTGKNITHRRVLEEELKTKNEQLTKLSITDSLTELFNIRYFNLETRKHQKLNHRHPNRPLSVVLIDIDNFKSHNDKFGHLIGDKLLIELSDIVQKQIREDLDSAYRYGGDEFVILLPETDAKGAKVICERIITDYQKSNVGDTSLSIGIAQYQKKWGSLTANLIVEKADEAMYTVKKLGGNGIHVYSEPISQELQSRPDPKKTSSSTRA